MKSRCIYDPVAFKELRDAVHCYLTRNEHAAERFANEIEEKIGLISENPSRYKVTHKQFRESSLKNFPYSIVYFWMKPCKLSLLHLSFIKKEIRARSIKNKREL